MVTGSNTASGPLDVHGSSRIRCTCCTSFSPSQLPRTRNALLTRPTPETPRPPRTLSRRAKPVHAHNKPAAKLSAATNDTALTNDQRNHKIDRAMPVRATHTHTSPPRGTASLPGYNLCSTKASEHNHAHADERHASRLLAEPLEERAGRPREEGDSAAGAPRACILPDTTPRLTLEHACLEHASLPKSTRCPEHTLAPTPPSQRQRYPPPHTHTPSHPCHTVCERNVLAGASGTERPDAVRRDLPGRAR